MPQYVKCNGDFSDKHYVLPGGTINCSFELSNEDMSDLDTVVRFSIAYTGENTNGGAFCVFDVHYKYSVDEKKYRINTIGIIEQYNAFV